MLRIRLAVSLLAFGIGAVATPAGAQDYPNQAVRFVIPFATGGGSDLHGRFTADLLSKRLGQPVVVENKTGAGGTIGGDYVAKSKPDGYTILYASSDLITIGPAVKAIMPYKVPDDFAFIGRTLDFPFIVIANKNVPFNTLAEMIAYGKANPKKLRYGSSGVGGGPHMTFELIAKAAGIEMTHIPYTGAGQSITALMGGFIDMIIGGPAVKEFTEAGTARAIVQTGKQRDPNFPNLPTLAEAGLGDVSVGIWFGIMAPAATPEPILARLRKEVAEITKDPDASERLKKLGYTWAHLDPAAFKDHVARELGQWKGVAQAANIKIE